MSRAAGRAHRTRPIIVPSCLASLCAVPSPSYTRLCDDARVLMASVKKAVHSRIRSDSGIKGLKNSRKEDGERDTYKIQWEVRLCIRGATHA